MNLSLKQLLVCVSIFVLSELAVASPFSDAQIASKRGNHAKAAALYRSLAEQGDALAQMLLGMKYYDGRGVPQDYVLAHMWIDIAAANSDADKQKTYIEIRELVAKQLTANQVADAKERARKCTASKFKRCY